MQVNAAVLLWVGRQSNSIQLTKVTMETSHMTSPDFIAEWFLCQPLTSVMYLAQK